MRVNVQILLPHRPIDWIEFQSTKIIFGWLQPYIKVAFSPKRKKEKCLYVVANSQIAEQTSHLAESPHMQLPFKRGKAILSLKSVAFLPNKTLVKRYLTLVTNKISFFCFTDEQVRLTETHFREKRFCWWLLESYCQRKANKKHQKRIRTLISKQNVWEILRLHIRKAVTPINPIFWAAIQNNLFYICHFSVLIDCTL